ncbi:AAA family ATPase [Acetivibrio saccincola]|uniref:Magnesium chelatase n=1 Tax=Acetivibrio saccincola TaxID=1677857 RepID=A0A2S8RE91_9FIRM|nr:MoxR family ATPase [Acetivibrio saccincola]NLW26622.1 MoxR family ATPase [Acetivibrio saccincola]PQQ68130.1 magnesium chelatase [Acetivibrio saccincola]HOA96505.1 MoxR family ATPase [Acetivibrio saccincola]HQD28988.1 MoxR family ATPase [Acetivibrio saccincola]
MNIEEIQQLIQKAIDEIGKVFVTEDQSLIKKILCGFLAGGHILFEDNPGLGKTLLVKILAKATGCEWKRIQFTPDLMPSDILGTKIWKGTSLGFELEKGPVFTNFLLADEINRAMPKSQSALLEAMEERQVSIEGTTHVLKPPFIVMATQNPIEMEGTYPLPEAQMDRFMMKLSLGYLKSEEKECQVLKRRIMWQKDDPTADIQSVITMEQILKIQGQVEKVYVDDNVLMYITRIIRKTREDSGVKIGASPRGGLALLKLSRAKALIDGRDYVIPDDVKFIAVDALAHRIILHVEHILEGKTPEAIVKNILKNVEVPKSYRRDKAGGF